MRKGSPLPHGRTTLASSSSSWEGDQSFVAGVSRPAAPLFGRFAPTSIGTAIGTVGKPTRTTVWFRPMWSDAEARSLRWGDATGPCRWPPCCCCGPRGVQVTPPHHRPRGEPASRRASLERPSASSSRTGRAGVTTTGHRHDSGRCAHHDHRRPARLLQSVRARVAASFRLPARTRCGVRAAAAGIGASLVGAVIGAGFLALACRSCVH